MLNMAEKEIPVPAESVRITAAAVSQQVASSRKKGLKRASESTRKNVITAFSKVNAEKAGEYVGIPESVARNISTASIHASENFNKETKNEIIRHAYVVSTHIKNQLNE